MILDRQKRLIRSNLRNFLLVATRAEMEKEIALRENRYRANPWEAKDFEVGVIRELITELDEENSN